MADGGDPTTTGAPLLSDLAQGPADGAALWVRTSDGLRIRLAVWGADAPHGTVLMFPGRTEAIEKYGRVAQGLRDRGFATLAIDWRGQGLSDRLHDDPALGHIGHFTDYQRDIAAMVAHASAANLPRPCYLLAHSMGGAIGLRALALGLDVRAAAFSSPMWGIAMATHMIPVAWTLSAAARPLRLDHVMAPGQPATSYLLTAPFEGNTLTTDPDMWAYMRAQVAAEPRFGLGGPSLRWLNEALLETRRLRALPAPDVPTQTFLGSDELIVLPSAIRSVMSRWPKGRLTEIPGARHEILMESPARRTQVFDAIAAHFRANA
jgi:lysophospholipase